MGGVGRIQGETLRVYPSGQGLPDGSIQSIVEDRDGTIWAGGPSGVARLRGDRWERVEGARGVARLFVGRSGSVLAAAADGVFRWNRAAHTLELIAPGRRLADVAEDSVGTVWTTGQPVLRQLDAAEAVAIGASGTNGYRLLRDRRNHLWIATLGQGLLHVRSGDWSEQAASERITQQQGLTSDRVLSLFEDAEGNIWVGTSVGLNRLSAHVAGAPVASRPEFDGHNVRAVAIAADGTVWTGTDSGVNRLSRGRSQWFREAEGLPSGVVRALHTGADGRLWVATDQGPAEFDGARFTALHAADGVSLNQISAITSDAEGDAWMFDARGVYESRNRTMTRVAPAPGPGGRRVSSAVTDRDGRIWAGFSGGGVMVYDRGRTTSYTTADGLSGDMVTAIHEATSGTIWVGTLHGLSRFDGTRFTTVTHAEGLPGNRLTAILGDEKHGLWLGTDFGFARITPDDFERAARRPASNRLPYRPVDASDGLDGIPTNRGYPNAARLNDGTLWFVTSGGVTVLAPAALREPRLPTAPRIERAIADAKVFAPALVDLPPRTVHLQVDYTSLTLSTPLRLRFRYKLEGNDPDWTDAGERRQAFYTNLPPGRYRFRVAAAIGGGEWIESPRPWEFAIQPAVYQTTWFVVACALGAIALSWSAWRYRLHQIRRQHALVIAERTRLAREIHDTLLQAMAGVALQLHRASELVQSAPPAKELCERARDSLERYIRDARFAIWRLRSPELIDTDVDTALRKVADDVTAGTGVSVLHRSVGTTVRCSPEIEEHLLRIGQEALHNVIRHADATTVEVGVSYEPHRITLRVADNGRGFDVDTPTRAHWGLAGMREHSDLAGGALTVTSAPGSGTVVEATVPLQR
jgi:signal transduction histidine kinase